MRTIRSPYFFIECVILPNRAMPPAGAIIRRMTGKNGAQTLLIDADDTLWENNIYFERAIARFISFLNHRDYSPEQVREILNEVERDTASRVLRTRWSQLSRNSPSTR